MTDSAAEDIARRLATVSASGARGDAFRSLWATLRRWHRCARERDELARMSERELHDLGLSPSAIYTELQKPFWRA
jgi:uncharacterized protein YjiS (DUF1127 family)